MMVRWTALLVSLAMSTIPAVQSVGDPIGPAALVGLGEGQVGGCPYEGAPYPTVFTVQGVPDGDGWTLAAQAILPGGHTCAPAWDFVAGSAWSSEGGCVSSATQDHLCLDAPAHLFSGAIVYQVTWFHAMQVFHGSAEVRFLGCTSLACGW